MANQSIGLLNGIINGIGGFVSNWWVAVPLVLVLVVYYVWIKPKSKGK